MKKPAQFKITCAVFCLAGALSGCVPFLLGTRVRQPPPGASGYYSKVFDCSYETCYDAAREVVREMGVETYVMSKEEHYISAMRFQKLYKNCLDMTEVEISFAQIAQDRTQVNVSCGNSGLARFASDEIFSRLGKKVTG